MTKNFKWRKPLRSLHRDLGYLTVGLIVIYALSGIILNHKSGESDPAYKTVKHSARFEKGLSSRQLTARWLQKMPGIKLNRAIEDQQEIKLYLKGGIGNYKPATGVVETEVYEPKPIIRLLNRMHYGRISGWRGVADIFAGILIFLALSGMVILPGPKGFKKRGVWLVLAGILIPVLWGIAGF
ncbi:peptidase [Marinilabiliaceae bacterium JC017]|nr:peptidase [Marinilabiliaceae bacterium JC017]